MGLWVEDGYLNNFLLFKRNLVLMLDHCLLQGAYRVQNTDIEALWMVYVWTKASEST